MDRPCNGRVPNTRHKLCSENDREKEDVQVYHINMFKPHHKRPEIINYIMEEEVHDRVKG